MPGMRENRWSHLRIQSWPACLITAGFLAVLGCAKDPVQPKPLTSIPRFQFPVDDSPVWSHDGRLIAYHRKFASSDGPPGIYVIGRWGGKPRFLAPGSFFWPTFLRFSPDDRFVVATSDLQLIIADVENATWRQPMYTNNGAVQPDWSPDGQTIVYSRRFGIPGQPEDSSGLHLFEPATGIDRAIHRNGHGLFGLDPLWSPDGSEIAFIESGATSYRICMFQPDGSGYRILATSSQGTGYDYLRWMVRAPYGTQSLLFQQISGPEGGPYRVNRDGTGLERLPTRWHVIVALSPDGSEYVNGGTDLADSASVLFVYGTDDLAGVTGRQLTRWDPPPGVSPDAVLRAPPEESPKFHLP